MSLLISSDEANKVSFKKVQESFRPVSVFWGGLPQPHQNTDSLVYPLPHGGSRNQVTDPGCQSWDCEPGLRAFSSESPALFFTVQCLRPELLSVEELLIFHLQFPSHNTRKYTDFSVAPVDAVGWPGQCFPGGGGWRRR